MTPCTLNDNRYIFHYHTVSSKTTSSLRVRHHPVVVTVRRHGRALGLVIELDLSQAIRIGRLLMGDYGYARLHQGRLHRDGVEIQLHHHQYQPQQHSSKVGLGGRVWWCGLRWRSF